MHVEVPMQAAKPAQSISGRSHHTHHTHKSKAPTVVNVVEEEPKVTVDVSVPAGPEAPTVVRSERPKPPTVRPLPVRAPSVHTVVDVEAAAPAAAFAEIVVDERSEHARGDASSSSSARRRDCRRGRASECRTANHYRHRNPVDRTFASFAPLASFASFQRPRIDIDRRDAFPHPPPFTSIPLGSSWRPSSSKPSRDCQDPHAGWATCHGHGQS
jgi:hypothetical protein